MTTEPKYHIAAIEPTDFSVLKAVEKVQVAAWGLTDRDVVPTHLLEIVAETGGQLMAARSAADGRIVGFVMALLAKSGGPSNHPGIPEGELFFASHMAAVLPEYQGGVGYELKQAQKDDAIQRGIRWMQWTYYPMLAKNASLNFRKLGAFCYRFVENKYGVQTCGLYQGLPSDRLVVTWDMQNTASIPFPSDAVSLTRCDMSGQPALDEDALRLAAAGEGPAAVICSVPTEFVDLRERDVEAARKWQTAFARVATALLAPHGSWSIVNFRRGSGAAVGEYLFIKQPAR